MAARIAGSMSAKPISCTSVRINALLWAMDCHSRRAVSRLVEPHGLLGATVYGEAHFVMPLVGHLGVERDAAAFVVCVYRVRRLGIAPAMPHACIQVDLQVHVTMLTGRTIRV